MVKVALIDGPYPTGHTGLRNDANPEAHAAWEKIRGMTVAIGKPFKPSVQWQCGTDLIWPILDREFHERIGRTEAYERGNTACVCRHIIMAGD